MELKNLISSNKVIKVEHPGLDGFIVDVAFISRDLTKKLVDKSTTSIYNRKTRQPEEDVDNDLFMRLYTKELVKGWTGLRLSYLPELVPVDFSSTEYADDEMLEYSEQNALDLMKNSTDFDNWLSSVVKDVKNFNKSN